MTSFAQKLDDMSNVVIIPESKKDIVDMNEISISPTEKKEGALGFFSKMLRFESLSKKTSAPESPTSVEPPKTYYGVYIPCEIKKGPDEEAIHVYKNKSDALELVRRYKSARFKAFNNRLDAISFALRGAEPVDTTDGNESAVMGEKPYPFKAPSSQDLVALRKAIEAGLATTVRDRVWDNPRYLVSSGNTPAILQEGCRYNALHVAAKFKNAEICNLILTTVGNPAFVQALYGSDSDLDSCKEFAEILVDRYLNTPDKARHETPLHFAANYGADDVVDVLTSFPQCDRQPVNKFNERPADLICKRATNNDPETVRRIASMLKDRYYVPVLHTEDDSTAPTIGQPFTYAQPPEISSDPLSPRLEIRAFAGPMPACEAECFRRKWKTPPRASTPTRARLDSLNTSLNMPSSPAIRPPAFRLQELSKGLETVGRNLAEVMKVGWKEYWPFLDTFTDLRTPEGLILLENYLKAKYESACSFAFSDSCIETHNTLDELSVSRLTIGNISQSPVNDTSMSPMSELCVALKTCKITSEIPPRWRKTDPIRQRLCRQPSVKSIITNGDLPPVINHTVSQLLCIERTCQVFAKRIADALTFSLTAEPEVAGESLKAEAKHLQHTIFTYMDDERFQKIDFALTHSRLAQLVVYKLKQQNKELDDINNLVEFLAKLRCPNDDIFSSDDERKPVMFRGPNRVKMTHVIDNHVRCLASFICEEVTDDETKGPAVSETICTELWEKAAKCRCDWKMEAFERNSKRNSFRSNRSMTSPYAKAFERNSERNSFRSNRSMTSPYANNDSLIRRLSFDHDIGDGNSAPQQPEDARVVNSPGGDGDGHTGDSGLKADDGQSQPQLCTIDVAKCQVISAEISEDESGSDSEYCTASESASSDDDMDDASEAALVEPFIYGDQPTKMDRLVFDAVSQCAIRPEQFPNVYRWRHHVALHAPHARDRWPDARSPEDAPPSPAAFPASPASPAPAARSTPRRDPRDCSSRALPLQMSTWLRVTGSHSPRSPARSTSFH